MSEQNGICQVFLSNFSEYRNKKIVLYGVGPNTKALLELDYEFQIIGLMDSKLTGEVLWGKEILSESQVEERETDAIIIVANLVSVKVIYRRIQGFADRCGIPVFDVNGNLLTKTEMNDCHAESSYIYVDDQMLKTEITLYDVISFDIFDTLIMRNILYPSDVYDITEKKIIQISGKKCEFAKERIKAEKELKAFSEPTLDEIYDRIAFAFQLTDEQKDTWRNLELETEKLLLASRIQIKDALEYARSIGKCVYLVSDMYLTSKDLETLLSICGIKGYEKIFVSCEYGMPKNQGLFEVMKAQAYEQYGEGCRILHIGDHQTADIKSGKEAGIDTFYIMSGRDMEAAAIGAAFAGSTCPLDDRIAEGILVKQLFENPFALCESKGKLSIRTAYDMAYCFAAPVITKYMFWMWRQVKENSIDVILFSARDGYLLKQLFEMMMQHYKIEAGPEAVYYLISRSSSVLASITDEEDILPAAEGYSGMPEDLLKERFHLKQEDILPGYEDKGNGYYNYILKHKEKIIRQSEEERQGCRSYAAKQLNEDNRRLAFVDMMSRGTCQRNFTSITGRSALGLYFFYRNLSDGIKTDGLKVKALYDDTEGFYHSGLSFTTKFPFLEILLSSPEPSLRCFKADGTPVYEDESRSAGQIRTMGTMQDAVKDYFRRYLLLKGSDSEEGISLAYTDWALGLLDKKYIWVMDDAINGLVFDNGFEGRSTRFYEIFG